MPEKIDAALLIFPENRRYFTGFASTDGYLAVTRDDAVFITDSRYIEAARRTVKDCTVTLQDNIYEQLNEYFRSHGVKTVGVENDRMTLKTFFRFGPEFFRPSNDE